ncbi:cache domain-containing protein [Shewanella maritima]|uniref:sensor histidine kinase n=1 Tax=Shewanella maritima TaxID=2520507 RepID=UPI0037354A9A
MSLFQSLFGITWQQMRAKVRYRLLVLTLLPILMTLVSLVFITIYWNISYTGQQLFMKVKADLAVANNTLMQVQEGQKQQLINISHSWDFHTSFTQLSNSNRQQQTQTQTLMNQLLDSQAEQYNLDFLRILNITEAAADPDLRLMLPNVQGGQPYSAIITLSAQKLARIDVELAERAVVPLTATMRAQSPIKKVESRGLVSRTVLPIMDVNGNVVWYLDSGILINHNTEIVDYIRDLVYADGTLPERSIGTVTIFLDDARISTNVPLNEIGKSGDEFERAVGTLVSDEVRKKVLIDGENWIDRAFVLNDWFISAYSPIEDIRGQRVGMIYTGFSESPFIHNYLLNIIELGTILMLVLLISGLLVYRGAYSLLQPIEQIHHVVKAVQSGRNVRIGELGLESENELYDLAEQFDRMLDLLQQRNSQIQAAAEQLEVKVEQRTHSLKTKTEELQKNVALLNETRQQLVTNEKLTALGELTAGIAHEINNPTAVILGNMELLKYELGNKAQDVEEEIDIVIQQVGRISTIIRSLLQYSRPGEFNAPIAMHPITPIVEEMLVLVRHSINKQQVELIKDLQATCEVEVNQPQILQVMINLVVNAAHASCDQGRIFIRSYDWLDDNGQLQGVKIEIEDEGVGISEEQLSRIFDPFYTTRKDGTGLGLSLSYGIIKRIGGTIEVESTLGKGTLFTIGLFHKAKDESSSQPYSGIHFGGRSKFRKS